MNLRRHVLAVYVIALFLIAVAVGGIPSADWKYVSDWQKGLFAFQILIAVCGVLMAYWLYDDEQRMDELEHLYGDEIEKLWGTIQNQKKKSSA
jgi:hypothetical protein